MYVVKQKVPTVEKKNLIQVQPSLGAVSLQILTKLQNALKGTLNCCQSRTIFKFQNSLSSDYRFNDQIPKKLNSGVEYKFQCGLFNEIYYGETVRHLVVRSRKHISLSPLTNKNVKPRESSITDHLLLYNRTSSLDDFSVLVHEDAKFRLDVKECLLTHLFPRAPFLYPLKISENRKVF